MVVQASSAGFDSGNYASITLNGVAVEVEPNSSQHHRGLHVVVIDPKNFKVQVAKAFDTYHSPQEMEEFIKDEIQDGFIVVAACKDDCVSRLSPKCRQWLAGMGSQAS